MTKVYKRFRADGVHPELIAFLDWWEKMGPFPIMVGASGGVRTLAEQQELYAKGRTTKGEPPYTAANPLGQTVTNAATNSTSPHGHAAALDIWPVNALGQPQFDTSDPEVMARYETIGKIGTLRFGFDWGGNWISRKDYPHLEVKGWATLPVVTGTTAVV